MDAERQVWFFCLLVLFTDSYSKVLLSCTVNYVLRVFVWVGGFWWRVVFVVARTFPLSFKDLKSVYWCVNSGMMKHCVY